MDDLEEFRKQKREATARYRARQKLIEAGEPIPVEFAVQPRGRKVLYATLEEVKEAGRKGKAKYRAAGKDKPALHARIERNRAVVIEAKANPCVDCGGRFPPIAMDFDHREGEVKHGGRTGGVARITGGGLSIERLLFEIAKCDLVCSNCHRVRTAKEQGWSELLTSEVAV